MSITSGSGGPFVAPPAAGPGQPAQAGNIGQLQLLAAMANPIALINGIQTFLQWTAPNDGLNHRVFAFVTKNVTSAETGGNIAIVVLAFSNLIVSGGFATLGGHIAQINGAVIGPGQTIQITQSTALTAGASTLQAELWGS